jgi:hypothetical protein
MKEYKVKSKSQAGKFYMVRYFEETDKWTCECPSYAFAEEGFECKHIKEKRKELKV